ncbi:MAG: fibronectin type III domain-containing protein, partial [Planctomycetota bacterium]|nr:fibronectin type III domain-containing protein [Planctomycetota bacterium]
MRVHVLPSALVIAATLLLVPSAFAAPPGPPENVTAIDRPDDAGSTIQLTWKPSTTTPADAQPVIQYLILRKTGDGEFEEIQAIAATESMFSDTGRKNGVEYFYSVIAVASDGSKSTPATTDTPAVASTQYFDGKRSWFLVILLLITCSIVYFINLARRGHELKIRKITGLEAVNEAVGRATEMGRSCLFIPGILDINDIQTVAGITVLSRVAGLAAEYDATLEVPTSRSLVMTTARETVEAAYLAAGRPDAYREDNIYYLTDEQFGYVAGVTGTMVREKPAACFYMGAFFAESLILAETGNSIGAIQVAGTAMPSQLPFFVAACDYTLIGEEFFAASAYLSGEKHQLGSLK